MANVLTANAADPQRIFDYQDEARRLKKFSLIGRVKCIVLEDSSSRPELPTELTNVEGLRLDWMDSGPVIGEAGGQLMFLEIVPPLPPRPPVGWKPSFAPHFDDKGEIVFDRPPLQERPFEYYTKLRLQNSELLVIQPLAQILVHPEGVATYIILKCGTDPATGTKMAFVVNPRTGAGYFYGGLYQIVTAHGAR